MLGLSTEEMCEINGDKFIKEGKAHAPMVLSILETLTKSRSATMNPSAITMMILAIFCKCKRPQMSLLYTKYIFSLLKYFDHCTKKYVQSMLIRKLGHVHIFR